MSKIVVLSISIITLAGCDQLRIFDSNATKTARVVASDFKNTPKCDTDNVYPHPDDTEIEYIGKIGVLNGKLDALDDCRFIIDEKADQYIKRVLD